jgi:hypothetical protein
VLSPPKKNPNEIQKFEVDIQKWENLKKFSNSVKETMSTTMHLFTFYLESDGMSTNNDYKHFFGALSLQFC